MKQITFKNQFYLDKNPTKEFSYGEWRSFINKICKKFDSNKSFNLHVISPFGFELIKNKKFDFKSIKRFYCYIGISNAKTETELTAISRSFANLLMESIGEIGINSSEIAILVIQNNFHFLHHKNYTCSRYDKLFDIQTRITDNILIDYGNYIICTIDSICSGKEEPKHFINNRRHRSRTYQLYVMLEQLFGYLLPSMTIFERENYCNLFKLIDNNIQMFYSSAELLIEANHQDIHILNNLIIPRVNLMRQEILYETYPDDIIKISCEAYHVNDRLELSINKKIYKKAIQQITDTYLSFA